MSKSALRILHLEDSRLDARLVEAHLQAALPEVTLVQAGDRPTYEEALRRGGWDLVLADYMVPGFSGMEALHLARASAPDIPFIVVTGAIGEESAVETLREGATDFLLKSRLSRLAPVIHRAIEENWRARERKAALEAQGERARAYRALANHLPFFVTRHDRNLRLVFANLAWQERLGLPEEEITGKSFAELGLEETLRLPIEEGVLRAFQEKAPVDSTITTGPHPDYRSFDIKFVPELNPAGKVQTVLTVARYSSVQERYLDQLRQREGTYRAMF